MPKNWVLSEKYFWQLSRFKSQENYFLRFSPKIFDSRYMSNWRNITLACFDEKLLKAFKCQIASTLFWAFQTKIVLLLSSVEFPEQYMQIFQRKILLTAGTCLNIISGCFRQKLLTAITCQIGRILLSRLSTKNFFDGFQMWNCFNSFFFSNFRRK